MPTAKKTAPRKSAPLKSPSAASTATAPKKSAKKASAKQSAAADKYTDPALRDRIKQQITKGDKGGRVGQWSARKAQMVAHEYEAQGGTYKGGKDETQQSLTAWGDEHWTTSDGKPAGRADGMHRYLPENAWKELSPQQKKATDHKKVEADHKGKQFVSNTAPAKRARKAATS